MSRYYSNYTTCFHCDNLTLIKQAIINLLEQEGGSSISQLPASIEETREQKIWMIGLFPAKDGWTIVKAQPAEILCYRKKDKNHPRLSALARTLGCDAFYLSVYAGTYGNCGILLEANAAGEVHIAGSCNPDIDVKSFYEQPINKPYLFDQFSLLRVPESFQTAMQINEHPEIVEKEKELERLETEENPDWTLLNQLRDEVVKGYIERIDEALAEIIDSSGCWAYPHLAYATYHYSDELAAAGGHFLYFQAPATYKNPPAYKLTPEQWLEIYGEVPFEN